MIEKLLKTTNKPHALILVEARFSNLDHYINEYIKSFLEDDEDKVRVDKRTYVDLVEINGYINGIKKQDILNIQNRFANTAFEKSKKRFYIIQGIEVTNNEAMNSLLKYIEDPQEDVYCILTTRNIAKVLPTIKSRCHAVYLKSNLESVNVVLKELNIDQTKATYVYQSYFNLEELKKDLNSGIFHDSINFINQLVASCHNIKNIKELHTQFKNFEYYQINKILLFLKTKLNKHHEEIVHLIKHLNFYPSKTLIFNQI